MNFTVELTTAPVMNDDWALLRHVIDIVPGTILLEDPEEPVLIVPVDAEEPMRAAMFCDGLSKLVGFQIMSGAIKPTPEVDFDVDEDDAAAESSTEVVDVLSSWVDSTPEMPARLNQDGNLICA